MPWDFWTIFFVLGVLIPWRGQARLQHILSQPSVGTKEKLVLYGSTIGFQWFLAAVTIWRALARGLALADLGLARALTMELFLVSLSGALLLGSFQSLNLRRIARTEGPVVQRMRKLAERLLPTNEVEIGPYCAVAVTAGVCEEFLYRGFAMAALTQAGLPLWTVVLISSILFGLAHAYQGRSGVAGTALLGLVFAISRVYHESLVPVMLWHTAVDIAAGIAGPKYLLAKHE
jgi:membrane protease YdiL (CAAX protease family)